MLRYLQSGSDKGLCTSKLRRQVAAILATRGPKKDKTMAQQPHIKKFFKGTSLINPPQVHRFPTWKLHLVLKALAKGPFELGVIPFERAYCLRPPF